MSGVRSISDNVLSSRSNEQSNLQFALPPSSGSNSVHEVRNRPLLLAATPIFDRGDIAYKDIKNNQWSSLIGTGTPGDRLRELYAEGRSEKVTLDAPGQPGKIVELDPYQTSMVNVSETRAYFAALALADQYVGKGTIKTPQGDTIPATNNGKNLFANRVRDYARSIAQGRQPDSVESALANQLPKPTLDAFVATYKASYNLTSNSGFNPDKVGDAINNVRFFETALKNYSKVTGYKEPQQFQQLSQNFWQALNAYVDGAKK